MSVFQCRKVRVTNEIVHTRISVRKTEVHYFILYLQPLHWGMALGLSVLASLSSLEMLELVHRVNMNRKKEFNLSIQARHMNHTQQVNGSANRVPPGPYKSLKVLKFHTFKYKALISPLKR